MTQKWMRNILDQYGQAVTLRTAEGDVSGKAFLQPVAENHEKVPSGMTGLGWTDVRQWLYLDVPKWTAAIPSCGENTPFA